MVARNRVRLGFLLIVLLAILVLVGGYLTASGIAGAGSHWQTDAEFSEEPRRVAPPTENVTVVTTQVFRDWVNEGEIVAFRPNGSILYYSDQRSTYHDVDPSPGGRRTVLYMAADYLEPAECPSGDDCTLNAIQRTNLTTGETTVVHRAYLPGGAKWHDVDRIDESRYLVADIVNDRVFLLNTRSDSIEWQWNASSAYPHSSGGPYPEDWTHVNDVEYLHDGRVMVSLRNQDQVVFVDPGQGLQEGWTLGAEDRYGTLYEQHNPDYIPVEHGGPAVIVADSENDRVVEYQRTDGDWRRTWSWQDASLQWPRDADRLPDGNTLVTDTNGNRVLEVTPRGEVVWEVDVGLPYEAERLGTGDESTNGPSATRLLDGEALRARSDSGLLAGLVASLQDLVPSKVMSGFLFVLPAWFGPTEVLALLAGGFALAVLGGLELYWRLASVVC